MDYLPTKIRKIDNKIQVGLENQATVDKVLNSSIDFKHRLELRDNYQIILIACILIIFIFFVILKNKI